MVISMKKRFLPLLMSLLLMLSACTAPPVASSPSPSQPMAPKVSVSPQPVEPSQPAAPTDSVSPPQPVEPSPAASASQLPVPGLSWVLPDPDPTQEPEPIPTPKPSPEEPETVTVYVTKTGKKYHSYGCQYLAKSCIPIDLDDAKASGYGPCSKCGPPR